MEPNLLTEFNAIELQRSKLFKMLSSIAEEQLHHKPSNDKWSILEILSHLIASEKLGLLYMQKKSLGIDKTLNYSWLDKIKYRFFVFIQKLHLVKLKAPSAVISNTISANSLVEATEMWNKERDELCKFLEGIPLKYSRRKIYRHPFMGLLGLPQAINFLGVHVSHHWPQIKNLVR